MAALDNTAVDRWCRVLDERHAAADALAGRGMSRSGYAMQGHAGSLTPAGYGNQ